MTRNRVMRAWLEGTLLSFRQAHQTETSRLNCCQKTWPALTFTYLFSYVCTTVASKIYNSLKTKYTTHICGGSSTQAKHVKQNDPNGCNCLDHDSSVFYFFKLQRIERKETVARKDVRFKLPLCCHC